jgi:molybdate/tungstate transport system substrate-binding protein
MILDGQRRPDVFVGAGTIPINKLLNSTDIANKSPLAHGLIKVASAEIIIAHLPTSKFHADLDNAKGFVPW